MADWDEAEDEPWPVKYPIETPPRQASGRFRRQASSRWAGTEKADTGEVRKRLLWLLLAVEVGMVVAAACVLPLVFLNPPARQEGVGGEILSKAGAWLGLSGQAVCLLVGLPLPILILMLGLNLGLYRWLRGRGVGGGTE